jgi:uncharacterized membrane protein
VPYIRTLVVELWSVTAANRGWMGWNTFLALVPLALALVLLWRPHRRTIGWWAGIVAFALFLPNAPYVVTDLIHLRWMAAAADSAEVLVFVVLPLFAVFIAVGYASYLICLELIVREVRSVRPALSRGAVELPVHALCALGIVLGRVTRLNSWDTVTAPRGTAERIFTTLSWQGAPFAFLATFVAVWITATVLRVLARAAWSWMDQARGTGPGGRLHRRRTTATSAPIERPPAGRFDRLSRAARIGWRS